MRAVALSDSEVQNYVREHFIPLKVEMLPGEKELPLKWPSLLGWNLAYKLMGGEKCNGFTGCMVVSPDLNIQYGGTGSASIWELFDSVAYDRNKFLDMLKLSQSRFLKEQEIRSNPHLTRRQKSQKIGQFRGEIIRRGIASNGGGQKPKGFKWGHALELFRMSGDLP